MTAGESRVPAFILDSKLKGADYPVSVASVTVCPTGGVTLGASEIAYEDDMWLLKVRVIATNAGLYTVKGLANTAESNIIGDCGELTVNDCC